MFSNNESTQFDKKLIIYTVFHINDVILFSKIISKVNNVQVTSFKVIEGQASLRTLQCKAYTINV